MLRIAGDRSAATPSRTAAWPRITVAMATVTAGEERDRLFERFAAEQPQLLDYASQTTREIPIVALVRG
jgi:hypothetical protein